MCSRCAGPWPAPLRRNAELRRSDRGWRFAPALRHRQSTTVMPSPTARAVASASPNVPKAASGSENVCTRPDLVQASGHGLVVPQLSAKGDQGLSIGEGRRRDRRTWQNEAAQ